MSFREFAVAQHPMHVSAIWKGQPLFDADAVYGDEEFEALLAQAEAVTGMTHRSLLLDFGRFTAKTLFHRLRPAFYESAGGTRLFLLQVEERIHEVLRTSIPGAAPPSLQVRPFGTDGVAVAYLSRRRLCDLVEGLIAGTAEFYGETFAIDQATCMHRGDQACSFFVTAISS